ncbi:YbgC/FadM family acyl-CoA thioesterase [Gammaproteobacteria bacterium]|nr:YbgC/FadM family acyl-CoA thioesterase [Gammaproteobacteria bacterium]
MNPRFKFKDFNCRVYIEDTDFQGVVYHANYLKYLERARSQFLIENHLSQTEAMSKGNESFVVRSINLSYYHPAKLEDDLCVSTEIELVSKARTIFFQSVSNIKNDTLICKGEVEVCFIDNDSRKPKAFPLGLLNLFES